MMPQRKNMLQLLSQLQHAQKPQTAESMKNEALLARRSPYAQKVELQGLSVGLDAYFGKPVESMSLRGKYDYGKQDAINRLHGLPLDGSAATDAPSTAPVESWDMIERDFWGAADSSRLTENVEYLASRYVAVKDKLSREYTGAEYEQQAARLDELMKAVTEQLAGQFAQETGGLFEQYGMTGEQERMKESVLAGIREKVEQYSAFVRENSDYVSKGLQKGEEWLMQDSAYLASEMRKAVAQTQGTQNVQHTDGASADSGLYSLKEMEQVHHFAKQFAQEQQWYNFTNFRKWDQNNEESLGFQLADLALKGKAFQELSGVSDRLQAAVEKVIDDFTEQALNQMDELLKKKREAEIEAIDRLYMDGYCTAEEAEQAYARAEQGYAKLDRAGVYDIIRRAESLYSETGKDATKALIQTALYAQSKFYNNLGNGSTTGIKRYESSNFWGSFFKDNGEQHYVEYGKGHHSQSGKQNKLVFSIMIDRWNGFMKGITQDERAFVTTKRFSATA